MLKLIIFVMMVGSVSASVVDEVPMFSLKDGKKQPFKLWSGTAYVGYYFSASWCPPCRKTTPPLVEEYQRMLDAEDMPVEIVLVGADRSEEDMLGYMKKYKMKWPAVEYGKEGMLDGYASEGIPHFVLVERKTGKAVAFGTGPGDIEKAVEKMREYSGIEGGFSTSSFMDRYALLIVMAVSGLLVLYLKKSRERRARG